MDKYYLNTEELDRQAREFEAGFRQMMGNTYSKLKQIDELEAFRGLYPDLTIDKAKAKRDMDADLILGTFTQVENDLLNSFRRVWMAAPPELRNPQISVFLVNRTRYDAWYKLVVEKTGGIHLTYRGITVQIGIESEDRVILTTKTDYHK